MSKKLERSGDEVSEKGRVGRKGIRFPSVASPPPPTPYFRTLSRFSSPSRALGKGKDTAATEANYRQNRKKLWLSFFAFSLSCTLRRTGWQMSLQAGAMSGLFLLEF